MKPSPRSKMYSCPTNQRSKFILQEYIYKAHIPAKVPATPAICTPTVCGTKRAKMANTLGNGGESSDHGRNHGGAEGSKPSIKSMVDQGSAESYRFYLSRKTALEMLKDRGCNVDDSELTRSLTEFRSLYGDKPDLERLRISASLRSNPSIKILVVFMGTIEIRKATVRTLYGEILKRNLSGLILILHSKMSSFAQKELQSFPFKVEVFQIADLHVNITKHQLMPKHKVLTAEEKQKLLKRCQIEDKQLPQILKTDPIARYYGLEKGQVVKESYSNDLLPFHEQYRRVV